MLAQRRRRWANIKLASVQRLLVSSSFRDSSALDLFLQCKTIQLLILYDII